MKRRIEERELLNEVLGDTASEEFRQSTLEQGLSLMRRKRAVRRALRTTYAAIPLIGLAAVLMCQTRQTDTHPISNLSTASAIIHAAHPKVVAGTSIRILSDQELLDVFKDRPVALVGQPGEQRLLLLDESPN